MMKFLTLFSVLFFVAMNVKAADVLLTYDTPTQREDGTALPFEEISGYKLYSSHNGVDSSIVNIPPGQNSYQFLDQPTGDYVYQISTVDSDGLEGNKSPTVLVEINAGPSAPAFTRIIKETCDIDGNCEQEVILEVAQ